MRRALATTVVGCCLIALVAAGPASAQVQFNATVSVPQLRFPGVTPLEYRLTMTTDAEPARFAVLASPDPMGGRAGEGTLLRWADLPHLEGPGTYVPGVEFHALPACGPDVRFHGFEREAHGGDVSLPPNTTSTLVVPVTTGIHVPWIDSPAGLTFSIRHRLYQPAFNGPSTLAADQVVRAPSPRFKGRSGVHIRFRTTPRSTSRRGGKLRRISQGPIAIEGYTVPAVPGDRVVFRYVGPRSDHVRKIGTARVNRSGHFKFAAWRPTAAGTYHVWVEYLRQRSNRAADYACPRMFTLG